MGTSKLYSIIVDGESVCDTTSMKEAHCVLEIWNRVNNRNPDEVPPAKLVATPIDSLKKNMPTPTDLPRENFINRMKPYMD